MYEIAKSDTATRLMIDNTPTQPTLVAAQAVAVNVLDPIREHFGIPFAPTSWYRGEKLEKAINDAAWKTWCARKGIKANAESWKQYFALKSHPKGEAVDVQIPGVPNPVLADWVEKNIPAYDQLILEYFRPNDPMSGWVHVSFSLINNRKQKFEIG